LVNLIDRALWRSLGSQCVNEKVIEVKIIFSVLKLFESRPDREKGGRKREKEGERGRRERERERKKVSDAE